MRSKWLKRTIGILVALVLVITAGWLAWPRPISVDIAVIGSSPMEVTVDDEAKTRVRNVYTVSAPLAGKVLRSPRRVGDTVTADETIVAVVQAMAPPLLDIRSREELQAIVQVTEAAVTFAEAEVKRLETVLEFSRTELNRAERLFRTNAIAAKALDKARFDVETNAAALSSAKAQLDVRRHEYHNATARLIDPDTAAQRGPTCCIEIHAPVSGRVLKILQESESVVQPGTPLIEIGDPQDLEVVADLLSTDAVQIKDGARVRIDGWGGPPLRGRVRSVEPSGFVKVSALGIEEQRVRTVIELVDLPAAWSRLGHDFRVVAHVVIWNADNVLTVPVGALFRKGDDWAVFVIRNGQARASVIQAGHRNKREVEIVSGLSAGDRVVLHPSDRIRDGVAVVERDGR